MSLFALHNFLSSSAAFYLNYHFQQLQYHVSVIIIVGIIFVFQSLLLLLSLDILSLMLLRAICI